MQRLAIPSSRMKYNYISGGFIKKAELNGPYIETVNF